MRYPIRDTRRETRNTKHETRPSSLTFHVSRLTFHVSRLTFHVAILPLLLLLLSVGCGQQESSVPGKTPSRFTQLATREVVEGLSREAVVGKKLYDHYCAVCHGETGTGDGFNAFNLRDSFGVTPANLAEVESPLTIEVIQETVRKGGVAVGKSKYMPPWGGTLDASQIHAVALYVQHFANAAETSQTAAALNASASSE